LNDFALLITAVGGFIAVVTPAFIVLRRELRVNNRVTAATHELTRHIDHAVNGKPAGAQTLQNQVGKMYAREFPPPEENGQAVLPLLRQVAGEMGKVADTLAELVARFPEK
jgi:hypothetical protein